MTDKQILIDNIDSLHTTEMGLDRIRKNLGTDTADPVGHCMDIILSPGCEVYRQGKNFYCETGTVIITVNSYSYTIITAHLKRTQRST
ncbi:MAG: DUF3781 domain-containing protein [Oscillospiraceae bacterium]|nr:DUF3781 domain-containing protein [Oscillospiraceae bacterium]